MRVAEERGEKNKKVKFIVRLSRTYIFTDFNIDTLKHKNFRLF